VELLYFYTGKKNGVINVTFPVEPNMREVFLTHSYCKNAATTFKYFFQHILCWKRDFYQFEL